MPRLHFRIYYIDICSAGGDYDPPSTLHHLVKIHHLPAECAGAGAGAVLGLGHDDNHTSTAATQTHDSLQL